MGILTKEVEVKLWGRNVKYYNGLGYKGKHGDIITVKVEDLQDGSNVKIQYLCDYCNKEIMTMVYANLTRRTKNVNKMACRNCFYKKAEETMLLKYDEPDYRKQIINKALKTFRDKTGYDYPSQSPKVREKITQSYIKHYGVDNPQLSPEVREKTEKTCLERYGYISPCQSSEVKEKMAKTLYKNGTTPTSKQQIYLFNLYKRNMNALLNYQISYYNVDICLLDSKIVIEYDGGYHDSQVKLGILTQEEFNKKEIIRDKVIKSQGYKIIRIKSEKDRLASDKILIQMLEQAKEYFFKTNHSWCVYDIDKSLLFNAEYKDGVHYSYGELRKIKDIDLNI